MRARGISPAKQNRHFVAQSSGAVESVQPVDGPAASSTSWYILFLLCAIPAGLMAVEVYDRIRPGTLPGLFLAFIPVIVGCIVLPALLGRFIRIQSLTGLAGTLLILAGCGLWVVRRAPRAGKVEFDLRNIVTAIEMYQGDNNGRAPATLQQAKAAGNLGKLPERLPYPLQYEVSPDGKQFTVSCHGRFEYRDPQPPHEFRAGEHTLYRTSDGRSSEVTERF